MKHSVSLMLWITAAGGAVFSLLILAYAFQKGSGHTGWEPYTAFVYFIPLFAAGAFCWRAHRVPSRFAVGVAIFGVLLVTFLDQTNRLVEYSRWLQRGMPEYGHRSALPSQWSQPGVPLPAMTGSTMDMNGESPGGSLRR